MSTCQRCNCLGLLFKYRKLRFPLKGFFKHFHCFLLVHSVDRCWKSFTRNTLFCAESWAWCLNQMKSVLIMYCVRRTPSVYLGILKWHDLRRSLAATSVDMLLAYWCLVMWRATIKKLNIYYALPVETIGELVYLWPKNKERAKDRKTDKN